jgi:hypothetical protein
MSWAKLIDLALSLFKGDFNIILQLLLYPVVSLLHTLQSNFWTNLSPVSIPVWLHQPNNACTTFDYKVKFARQRSYAVRLPSLSWCHWWIPRHFKCCWQYMPAFRVVGRATSDVLSSLWVWYLKRALRIWATNIFHLSVLIFSLCLYVYHSRK